MTYTQSTIEYSNTEAITETDQKNKKNCI